MVQLNKSDKNYDVIVRIDPKTAKPTLVRGDWKLCRVRLGGGGRTVNAGLSRFGSNASERIQVVPPSKGVIELYLPPDKAKVGNKLKLLPHSKDQENGFTQRDYECVTLNETITVVEVIGVEKPAMSGPKVRGGL